MNKKFVDRITELDHKQHNKPTSTRHYRRLMAALEKKDREREEELALGKELSEKLKEKQGKSERKEIKRLKKEKKKSKKDLKKEKKRKGENSKQPLLVNEDILNKMVSESVDPEVSMLELGCGLLDL